MSQEVAITHSELAHLEKVGHETAMNIAAVSRAHASGIASDMMPGFLGKASGTFVQLNDQDLRDMDKIRMHHTAMTDLIRNHRVQNQVLDDQHVGDLGKLMDSSGGGSGLGSTINV
jgi:hypothetical protein